MTNTIPGYITEIECQQLRTIFAPYNKVGAIGVEIGSLHGRSSYEISKTIPLGKLYCIDGWDGYDSSSPDMTADDCARHNYPVVGTICTLAFFKENTKDCENITTYKTHSPRGVLNWQGTVDFVFLDALHANPSDWDNIEFWLPRLNRGGRFVGHDFYPNRNQWPDVYDNVRRLEQQLGKAVINPAGTSLWYFDIL